MESIVPKQYMRPGVKALIVHEGKILVVTEKVVRDGKPYILHDFPGGGIEFGEELAEALEREVFEEVGLKIKVGRAVGNWMFVIDSLLHEGSKVQIICLGYQCSVVGSTTIDMTNNPATEDIYAYEWLTPEEILARGAEFLGHQDMIEAVKNVRV